MRLEVGAKTFPGQTTSALTSASEPLEPDPLDPISDLLKAASVSVDTEVLEMTAEPPAERGMLILERQVPVAPYVIRYAMKFTRLTRGGGAARGPAPQGLAHARGGEPGDVPDFVREYVTWGAGPRATQYLILAAKARAVLHGRYYVSCEDVRAVAAPVLRHRIITNFNAEAEGIKPDDIVKRLTDLIPRDPAEKVGV